jgi:YfiH family protein
LRFVDLGPEVRAAFTTSAFDLATASGRAALGAAWGGPLAFAQQVHGADLAWVDAPGPQRPGDGLAFPAGGALRRPNPPDLAGGLGQAAACDGLATGTDGIGLVIRVADCLPVLLADRAAGLVAALHAGWRGLLAGLLPAALAGLRQRGASQLRAALGPSICPSCYEVGADLARRAASLGHVASLDPNGAARLDLAASVRAQLARAGVEVVDGWEECTAQSARLFSWRARRQTGRQGAVIALA